MTSRRAVISRWVWCVLTTLIYYILTLPLDLIGALLVPFAILHSSIHSSPITGQPIFGVPRGSSWLWLWSNDQEGFDPAWYVAEHPGWPTWLRRYVWGAWRNKTSNLRFLGWLKPDPAAVVRLGHGNWSISYSGWLTHWLWDRPASHSFTSIGARIDASWAEYGTNFAIRLYGRY